MTKRRAVLVEEPGRRRCELKTMGYWNIAVIAHPGPESEAGEVAAHLTRKWNSHPTALFKVSNLDQLESLSLEDLDAVVLVVDGLAKGTELVRPLTRLEEQHVPVLALLEESPDAQGVFEHAAVLVEGRSTPGAVLCARLHGMLHRQREIDRLRSDIAVARASHAGLGDEVAKMHEELQLAAHAQRELLPDALPALHGVSVATLWRPAQYVSGDIYDVTQLDDDHIGLFLADAVGHGVSAALMTMVICQSLITRILDGSSWRILDPGEVLSRLNQQMLRHRMHPSRFATAVYAVIDCRYRRMALAGAGHPPPLLVHEGGRVEPMTTGGGLLGVFEDETYDQVETDLATGDHLLLYTDGFEQAFPQEGREANRCRPTTRYRREFEELCAEASPQDMIQSIAHRLDAQAGSLHQIDDLTLLCMHAGPLAKSEQVSDPESLAA
ncbi:MAG: PP2C family protein-serine/threonine phosphatase [Planctomycetota bacterium]|jgi:sigma-B regulation protein RsbU (phosphoserine phosphatase)